jgi:serine/threonine-protein kinase RsbW
VIGPRSDLAGTGAADDARGYRFQLAGGPEAASAARRAVAACDGDWPPAVRDDVLLLVTELVTNAVRHAGVGPAGSLEVELWLWPQRVRVEVVDPGSDLVPARPRSKRDGTGGWGLVLVDRIAARWGVGERESDSSVWFEVEFERA